jgi:hypothetical protein
MSRWHELKKAVQKSDLRPSDRLVYLHLLGCSSYATAELEPRFSPTLKEVARDTGLSRRMVPYALRHLERHGWLKVSWPKGPGRGHKLAYELLSGEACDCPDWRRAPGSDEAGKKAKAALRQRKDAGLRPGKDARDAGFEPGKGAQQAPEKAQEWGASSQVRPDIPLSEHQEAAGAREVENPQQQNPRPRPSGYLLRRIPKIVAAAPGGGLGRDELAAALRVKHAADPVFVASLMVCYRRGQVDFVRDYVVAPARKSQESAEGGKWK